MAIDKSLKRGSRLSRSRNVLKRNERIEKMKGDDLWSDASSPLGLPKTRVLKAVVGKKKEKKKDEEDDKKSKKKK